MLVRWTPAAADDLETISNYLIERHPDLAEDTVSRLYHTLQSLKKFPRRGRIGRARGTRELVFAPLPYIAVYRVGDEAVEILRVYHTAQDWPG
jgi:addiction module RelE/StbE family toxin